MQAVPIEPVSWVHEGLTGENTGEIQLKALSGNDEGQKVFILRSFTHFSKLQVSGGEFAGNRERFEINRGPKTTSTW